MKFKEGPHEEAIRHQGRNHRHRGRGNLAVNRRHDYAKRRSERRSLGSQSVRYGLMPQRRNHREESLPGTDDVQGRRQGQAKPGPGIMRYRYQSKLINRIFLIDSSVDKTILSCISADFVNA